MAVANNDESGAVSERDEILEKLLIPVHKNSKVLWLIFLSVSSVGMLEAVNMYSYQFLGETPEKYWCAVDELTESSLSKEQIKEISIPSSILNGKVEYSRCEMYQLNYTAISSMTFEEATAQFGLQKQNDIQTVKCSKRIFEGNTNSFVTKWDLVCDRRSLYATAQSAVQSGFIIDPFIFGYLTDRYGRKRLFLSTFGLAICCGLALSVAPFLWIFIVLRMFLSTFSLAAVNAGIVLCLEMCSVKQRSIFGPWFSLQWAIGIMVLPIIAYFVKTWYYLQLAVTLPFVLLYTVIWSTDILSESPRWLILNKRYEEAYYTIKKLADSINYQLPEKEEMIASMQKISYKNENNSNEKVHRALRSGCSKMGSIFTRKDLRLRSLLVVLIWFSPSMVYYGVGLGADVIDTNEYLFIFFSGLVEFVSLLALSPITSYFGRRFALLLYFFVTAVSILTVAGLQFSLDQSELEWLRVVLYLSGKFAIAAAYQLIWVYTSELYPTNLRSLAAGGGSTVAKAGNFFSPYINEVLGAKIQWAPAATFGAFTVVSAIGVLFLPETYDDYLREDAQLEEQPPSTIGDEAKWEESSRF